MKYTVRDRLTILVETVNSLLGQVALLALTLTLSFALFLGLGSLWVWMIHYVLNFFA